MEPIFILIGVIVGLLGIVVILRGSGFSLFDQRKPHRFNKNRNAPRGKNFKKGSQKKNKNAQHKASSKQDQGSSSEEDEHEALLEYWKNKENRPARVQHPETENVSTNRSQKRGTAPKVKAFTEDADASGEDDDGAEWENVNSRKRKPNENKKKEEEPQQPKKKKKKGDKNFYKSADKQEGKRGDRRRNEPQQQQEGAAEKKPERRRSSGSYPPQKKEFKKDQPESQDKDNEDNKDSKESKDTRENRDNRNRENRDNRNRENRENRDKERERRDRERENRDNLKRKFEANAMTSTFEPVSLDEVLDSITDATPRAIRYPSIFNKIPRRFVLTILSHLEAKDLVALSAVNHYFNRTCQQDTLWKNLAAKDFGINDKGNKRNFKLVYRNEHRRRRAAAKKAKGGTVDAPKDEGKEKIYREKQQPKDSNKPPKEVKEQESKEEVKTEPVQPTEQTAA